MRTPIGAILCSGLLSLLAGACSLGGNSTPPSTQLPGAAVCEGLRPDMPLTYFARKGSSGGGPGEDQPATIAQARRINGRFASLCP